MRSVTVIIVHVFVAQATAKESSVDKVADITVDKLLNKLVDKLTDRATELSVHDKDLDGTTLGKIQASMARSAPMITRAQPLLPSSVIAAQDKLRSHGISPSPLETLALTAIDANNRGTGMRNVIAMASTVPELAKLQKEVVAKATKISEMSGILAPTGFFDPLGFSTDIDDETLAFYREAELKHGRYGMLASLGMIAGEKFSPVFGATDALRDAPAASLFLQSMPKAGFWGAVIVAVSFGELIDQNSKQQNPDREGGDLGWDPLKLKPKVPAKLMEMKNKELNNGRLAMLAAAGIIAQELVTGQKIF